MAYIFFLCGAILAALSVAMGAYGAHSDIFDEVQALWVEKAVRYQMFHALALLITALAMTGKRKVQMHLMAAGICFLAGTILFSGSLYVMAFTTFDAGYITPAGGFLFIFGWILLAIAGPGSVKGRR
ncbi:MAG: DUF423 domain-containing protein [Desulfocapsaceae bacterium]|jgi:uncharacterized membrane protein YgdD (TMEM256/DUF423 family)|nr:DUF423 domain-containing protein [Desulfocapsaceae bacterium]